MYEVFESLSVVSSFPKRRKVFILSCRNNIAGVIDTIRYHVHGAVKNLVIKRYGDRGVVWSRMIFSTISWSDMRNYLWNWLPSITLKTYPLS